MSFGFGYAPLQPRRDRDRLRRGRRVVASLSPGDRVRGLIALQKVLIRERGAFGESGA